MPCRQAPIGCKPPVLTKAASPYLIFREESVLQVRDHSSFLVDRYSERKETKEKGRLLSQAEKEALKAAPSDNPTA